MISWRNSAPFTTVLGLIMLFSCLVLLPTAPAVAAPGDDVSITLDEMTPDYLGTDDDLTFRGSIENKTDEELESITVWWDMGTWVLNGETYPEWESGEETRELITLARHDLDDPLEAGQSTTFTMNVPPEESPFDYGSQPGPRGIELIVTATTSEGDSVKDQVRSTIMWFPEEESSTPINVAIPLTPSPKDWEKARKSQVPVISPAFERLANTLGAFEDLPVIWGVDASLLDSVPVGSLELLTDSEWEPSDEDSEDLLGWSTPERLSSFMESLRDTTKETAVISLGWAAPDVNSLGLAGPSGQELLARNDSRAAELFDKAGVQAAPDVRWSFNPVSVRAITQFDHTSTVLLPPSDEGSTVVPPTAQHLTLHSPDVEFIDLLTSKTSEAELRAQSFIAAQKAESVVVTLPPDLSQQERANAAANIETLTDAPWFELSTDVLSVPPQVNTTPAVDQLFSTADITQAANAVDQGEYLSEITTSPKRFRSLFSSTAFIGVSSVWKDDLNSAANWLTDLGAAGEFDYLEIEQPSTVNLISQDGELPIGVENYSQISLRPTVIVEPEDARLVAEEPVSATLNSESSSTVAVPITAVANGNVETTIRVVNDDGDNVATPQTFTIRVRADWETTGTAVFAGVITVGLLYGLFRNFKNARARNRENHG